jgi:sporulation protein YlmC with PRC-barrel domain
LEIDNVQAPTSSSNSTNLEYCEFSEIENVQFDSIVNPCISQVGKDITCSNRDDGTEQKLPSCDVIGRQVLRSDGVYVMGQVQGSEINVTVDTGEIQGFTIESNCTFSISLNSQFSKFVELELLVGACTSSISNV